MVLPNGWQMNKKKYRRVFDKAELTYVYAELSFFNKHFDEHDWNVEVSLRAYKLNGGRKEELCNLTSHKRVSKDNLIMYVREGWG